MFVLQYSSLYGDLFLPLKNVKYIKENPRKKISPLDMSRLFSDFLTFNINYTNNGDSILSPLSPTVNAKGTIAGAAITS